MADKRASEPDGAARRRVPGDVEASVSMLVRFWHEPREAEGEERVLRGYCRNLRTGEETYLQGPQALTEHLQRELEITRRKRDAETSVPDTQRAANR